MKKISVLLTVLVVATLLAACSGGTSGVNQTPDAVGTGTGLTTGTPAAGTGVSTGTAAAGTGQTTSTAAVGTGAGSTTSTPVTGTSAGSVTGTATVGAGAGAATSTPSAGTGTGTGSSTSTPSAGVVPATGTHQYALLSEVLKSRVSSSSGSAELGMVAGVVVNNASATGTTGSGSTAGMSVSGPSITYLLVNKTGGSSSTSGTGTTAGSSTATPAAGTGTTGSSASGASGSVVAIPWAAVDAQQSSGFTMSSSVSGSTAGSTSGSTGSTAGSTTATPAAGAGTSASGTTSGSTSASAGIPTLVVKIDESAIAGAPAFDPNMVTGANWDSSLQAYWTGSGLGIPATGASGASSMGSPVVIRGQIGSLNVSGSDGQVMGQVRDFVVDLTTGQLAYGVLSGGSTFGANTYLVPMTIFNWTAGNGQGADLGTFSANVPQSVFQAAPSVSSLNNLNFSTSGWNTQYDQFWQGQGGSK